MLRTKSVVHLLKPKRGLFQLLKPNTPVSQDTHQFVVGTQNGFLPRQDPLVELPSRFAKLEDLLQRMPLALPNGQQGLLAANQFGDAVQSELPLYDVKDIHDSQLLTALFRDYTFAASAYLLEPCDVMHRAKGDYALGRDVLPKTLAVPLAQVSAKIGAKPFMEYAQSYALYNYKRRDSKQGLDYNNLELIRTFSGMPSESGFILVHVAMVAHTGKQVKHTAGALEAIGRNDRQLLNKELKGILEALQSINGVMDTMWQRSDPDDYLKFRTFIMGTKNQPMFPKGVLYEGVSDQPTFYRGESGANDSIVPSADNFLQLTENMPSNPLTEILKDFRTYRPVNHNQWLTWVETEARSKNVREYCSKDTTSAVYYLALLDQVREFRNRHWSFTKEYIIKHTQHPVATGGSPIVTWLPNQLSAVLKAMVESGSKINTSSLDEEKKKLVQKLLDRASAQQRILDREVRELAKRFKGQMI